MKHGGKLLVSMMGGLAVCTAASGVTSDKQISSNPYQSIIDRNVFSLKPPPPPADPAETAKPTALKITLTGITTIFGDKRVLMKAAPTAGKPNEAKTEQSYILSQGQREGDLEVLEIDEKAGSVKVNNAGTIQTLTFEKDGAKLPSTPAPAVPGLPGAAPIIPGLPVTHPMQPAGGITPNFQLPPRIPRLPTAGAQGGYTPGMIPSSVPIPGAAPSYGTPGVLPGNTITPPNANPVQTPTPQYSLAEQQILIEAERQMGGPTSGLLPPTALTPRANVENAPGAGGAPAPTQQQQTPTLQLPIPGRPMPPGPY